jgi:hypothetical protein
MDIVTIGLDIAKSVFQVHGVDAAGEVVIRRKLTRGRVLGFFESLPRCLVGIEACSSSHYWARELTARGHDVRLLPAQYVKPYLKRQKMGWLPPSPDGIAMCQGRGVQRHEKERTANEEYNDRGGPGKERFPASLHHDDGAAEFPQEADTVEIPAVHVMPTACSGGDGGVRQRELLGAGNGQAWP